MSNVSSSPGSQSERDRARITRALEGHLTTAYQPIIDLAHRRVLGYEALLRYRDENVISASASSPDSLLASAQRLGRTAELEMAALRSAMRARDTLPRDCGLFLNVSVAALMDERVIDVLLGQGSLDGVVLELRDHELQRLAEMHDSWAALRDRGAVVAIADLTLKPESLELLMTLDPGYIKLDRRLIDGIADSRFKLAIVDSLRNLAENLHLGVIAQGIETLSDLESVDRLGITLGQGFLIAKPGAIDHTTINMSPLGERSKSVTPGEHSVARLVEPVLELTESELDTPLTSSSDVEYEVIVSDLREPLVLLGHVGTRVENLSLTVIGHRESIHEATRIAMRRSIETRFDPLVCVDELGTCSGVVRVDRLVEALLRHPVTTTQHVHAGSRERTLRSGRHPRRL